MKIRVAIHVLSIIIGLGGVVWAADLPDASGLSPGPAVVSCSNMSYQTEDKEDSPFESYCVADCGDFPDVSCNGDVCSAVNRNCSYHQRGYVVCDGVYTYCPVCPECEDGDFWFVRTGWCCAEGMEETDIYKCINEQWVWQRTVCKPSPKCPIIP